VHAVHIRAIIQWGQCMVSISSERPRLAIRLVTNSKSGLTAWDSPDLFVDDDFPPLDSLMPTSLHWHQLADVHSIVRNTFMNKSTLDHCTGALICDKVGLSKTALAISMMAFLNQSVLLQQGCQVPPPILCNYHHSDENRCKANHSRRNYLISREQAELSRFPT
jgi:hypothetical protein